MEPAYTVQASKRHASGLHWQDHVLVTGGMEGIIRFWDGDTQTAQWEGHTASVNSIATIGGRLVTAGTDKRVLFWDDGEIADAWDGYAGFAHHGDRLLLRKDRGDRVYMRHVGEPAARAAIATGLGKMSGVWAVPGAWAIGAIGDTVQLRRIDDLAVARELPGHGTAVTSVSSTDERIVTTDYDGGLHLWDLDGRRMVRVDTGARGYVFAAISPDGRHIAVAGGGIVTLRDAEGTILGQDTPGIQGLYGCCWSPDGRRFANAGADGRVRVYEI